MRFTEISEQTPIGTTLSGTSSGNNLVGNTAAIQSPGMQAAQLMKQKQEKDQQKKAIQDQITALQKQLADLNRAP